MFKNPFSFAGRIRRTEYGLSYIIFYFAILMIGIGASNSHSGFIEWLFFPLLWFICAQRAKRCHDRGNSGWYQFIPFYMLWMLFANSDIGENEYGINPKAAETTNNFD